MQPTDYHHLRKRRQPLKDTYLLRRKYNVHKSSFRHGSAGQSVAAPGRDLAPQLVCRLDRYELERPLKQATGVLGGPAAHLRRSYTRQHTVGAGAKVAFQNPPLHLNPYPLIRTRQNPGRRLTIDAAQCVASRCTEHRGARHHYRAVQARVDGFRAGERKRFSIGRLDHRLPGFKAAQGTAPHPALPAYAYPSVTTLHLAKQEACQQPGYDISVRCRSQVLAAGPRHGKVESPASVRRHRPRPDPAFEGDFDPPIPSRAANYLGAGIDGGEEPGLGAGFLAEVLVAVYAVANLRIEIGYNGQ